MNSWREDRLVKVLGDARSSCLITFEKKGDHRGLGLELDFVQDNCFFPQKSYAVRLFKRQSVKGNWFALFVVKYFMSLLVL